MDNLMLLAAAAGGYLLGSLSFSILLSHSRFGEDIRNHGSGNAGMTNMLRTFGKWAAVAVLAGDFLKGLAAALVGQLLAGTPGALVAGFFAVVGHAFPLYFQFRGGKGVATAAGFILGVQPLVLLIILAIFLLAVALSRMISLGSILAAAAYPVSVTLLGYPAPQPLLALCLGLLVIWLHRGNLVRILRGEERRVSFKKQP